MGRQKRWLKSRDWTRGTKLASLAALVVAVVALAVLFSIVGWSAVRQNWANGDPWFWGVQFAPLAIPLSAFIAAGVAITTARWGLASARATRENDHQRWEDERNAEEARRHTERRDATERMLRDRFHELVKLLASEDLRAREGAAYAIDALADDWRAHYGDEDPAKARAEQQVCVNVLIAQLRDPVTDAMSPAERAQLTALKHGVQKILAARLGAVVDGKPDPGQWSSLEFVFDGCWFHNLDLSDCVLTGSNVSFVAAVFRGKKTSFNRAHFAATHASFERANFSGEQLSFAGARFRGTEVSFSETRFTGSWLWFTQTVFESNLASFKGAKFAGPSGFRVH